MTKFPGRNREAGTGSNCSFPGSWKTGGGRHLYSGDQRVRWKNPNSGVCLGHQSICEAFGGVVSYAKELKHGKRDEMIQCGSNVLFKGLPKNSQQQDIIPWQQ